MAYLFAGLAVYLLLANMIITRHVWKHERRTNEEKVAETGLIWLVPFFGHFIALAISLEGPENVRKVEPTTVAGGVVAAVAGTS